MISLRYLPLLVSVAFSLAALAGGSELDQKHGAVDFSRDVLPILTERCYKCHGPDEAARKGHLRLDLREAAIGGEYPAIVPGDADASELIFRVQESDSERMPPPKAGPPLAAREIALLRRWIETGAEYAPHWSLVAPKKTEVPSVSADDFAFARNEIDAFVLARLRREGFEPQPEADRYTLIRRVSLDLTGLPPTVEEVDAWIADTESGAYDRMVDRFLASPAFGERWARVWLDLARYADSMGYEKDGPRSIWEYRDWVIRAFNCDLPFDRFTIEQIAGDLLPEPSTEQLVATAFHRNTMTNDEGGTDDEEFRVAAVADRVDTTMQVWMGMTMGCAQCHTHKYDPISHREYYEFFAFFNQTEDADLPGDPPTIANPSPEQRSELDRLRREIEELEADLAAVEATAEQTEALVAKRRAEGEARARVATTPVMREQAANERRVTHVLRRGSFLDPGEVVSANVPAAFHPWPNGASRDRLGLARWLVDEANPLTARVFVNRVWEQLFGTGLVETLEDFGIQGTPPTHPELLDWLAMSFMNDGWSVKSLIRRIVQSAAYRRSARTTPQLLERDPRNRMLARGPRFRLEAEMLRDQALAVSGLLSRKMYGAPVFPPQPAGTWQVVYDGAEWKESEGEDRYRRAIYTYWRRTSPYPSMTSFDAPSREVCVSRRIRTNTPIQALVTLNDPVFFEAAQALARRAIDESLRAAEARREPILLDEVVRHAFRLCVIRPPSEAELIALMSLYGSEFMHYLKNPDAARAVVAAVNVEPAGHARLAALTVLCNVLLNLDEFLTRG